MPRIRSERPLSRFLVAGLVHLLLGAPALGADGFAKPAAESPTAPPPAPVVSHYTPLPASYDAPITIHGTRLQPASAPTTTAVEDVPKPALFWGNQNHFGPIPESDILSWTDTSIQLSGLPDAPQGVYGIIVMRGNVIVSNFNQTLLVENGKPLDPGDHAILVESDPPHSKLPLGQLGKLPTGPIEPSPAGVAKDFFMPEKPDDVIIGLPPDEYLGLQSPTSVESYVASYSPAIVGADGEITLAGYFPVSENRRLVYGVLGDGVRSIQAAKVKSWGTNFIVLHPGAVPMGVWWIAVFAVDLQAQQITLVSNLNTGLQVTENAPPPSPPGNPIRKAGPGSAGPGGESAGSRIEVVPRRGGPRGIEKIHPSTIQKAPAATRTLEPRVREVAPKAATPSELEMKPESEAAREATPGALPSERLQPVPAPGAAEPRMIRKLR